MLQDITNLDFKGVLNQVCAQEKLRHSEVMKACQGMYSQLSEHFHGNSPVMTIDEASFTRIQVGALCFFKMQQKWDHPMKFTRIRKVNKVAKRLKANKENLE